MVYWVSRQLRELKQLLRPALCAMVALSALAGQSLATSAALLSSTLALGTGTFLFAAGASVLNQVQERTTDALMKRTCNRPLACGRMGAGRGALLALALLLSGGALLFLSGGASPLLLGLVGLVLYNGLYTPLKRRSSLCLLPGALCGALPPLMGWSTAGGEPASLRILLLSAALFLWQVPHFWTLAHRHREDLCRAGLALAPSRRGIVLVWLLAMGALTAFALAFGLLQLMPLRPLLFACFLWLLPPALSAQGNIGYSRLQTRLQLFLGALLTSIVVDGIVVG